MPACNCGKNTPHRSHDGRSHKNSFYSDDGILAFYDEEEAIEVTKRLVGILAEYGFICHKFSSNSKIVMESIPKILWGKDAITTIGKKDEELVSFNHKDDAIRRPINKCLGVEWSHENNTSFLTYNHWNAISEEARDTAVISRRKISSIVSKCFDPLGLACPLVLPGKIALHYSWKLKEQWDSPININRTNGKDDEIIKNISSYWKLFQDNMNIVNSLKVPRYYFDSVTKGARLTKKEIYVSGDTALHSRCIHVLLRAEFDTNEVKTSLVMAKTRINPVVKGVRISIPRLELTILEESTLLGVKLKNLLDAEKVVVFSDSKVAITQCVRGDKFGAGTLKTFVANRVTNILNNIHIDDIWYINTSENPSDIATRPITAKEFTEKSDLWLHGPKWLRGDRNLFPSQASKSCSEEVSERELELRRIVPLPERALVTTLIKP